MMVNFMCQIGQAGVPELNLMSGWVSDGVSDEISI